MFKKVIQKHLAKTIRKYFSVHSDVQLIVVAGSIGKTSTKLALATILSAQFKVRMIDQPPRSRIDTMLQILGINYPTDKSSLIAWTQVLSAARKRIKQPSDTQFIIQELDPYNVGANEWFKNVIQPSIAIITGISDGEMKGFESIEDYAKEILAVANFSQVAVINRDDNDGRFASFITNPNITTYGTDGNAEHRYLEEDATVTTGHSGLLVSPLLSSEMPIKFQLAGEHNLRPAIAACVAGLLVGMKPELVIETAGKIRPLLGHMNVLKGLKGSVIIDDSYSATYHTAMSALQTVYTNQAPQRIVVFGDMHDLGPQSPSLHEELGKQCDPGELAWVITVGEQTMRYLAPAAKARGCQVASFTNAVDAGAFVHKVLDNDALVLFKGSATGIYLEEAIKVILTSTADESQLVRQTPDELKNKLQYFEKFK